jgi:NAD(P)-dependent dehydrogenase (short-subunit alcohol dehydrogenase family)
MNLNVRGYFLLSQHIAKQSMIPNGSGKIINIASIQGACDFLTWGLAGSFFHTFFES